MPNLQFEKDQLLIADGHIATAETTIAGLRANVEAARAAGADTAIPERVLAAAESGLAAFRDHRALIIAAIADIEAGRLPAT